MEAVMFIPTQMGRFQATWPTSSYLVMKIPIFKLHAQIECENQYFVYPELGRFCSGGGTQALVERCTIQVGTLELEAKTDLAHTGRRRQLVEPWGGRRGK